MSPKYERVFSALFAALAGASFVAITQLAVKSDPQDVDRGAMWKFALALPLLVGTTIIFRDGLPTKNRKLSIFIFAAGWIGGILVVQGVLELIYAVNARASVAFGVLVIAMIGLMALADKNRK